MIAVQILKGNKAIALAKRLGVWHEIHKRIEARRVAYAVAFDRHLFTLSYPADVRAHEYRTRQEATAAALELSASFAKAFGQCLVSPATHQPCH